MRDQDHLNRINALTNNARNTWFALLGALVFVGITLMGVEHIDFYGVNRATKLPLVNVEVPTRYFFLAAPILIAAIYGYFHLYLIRLWDALGAAPSRLNGIRLGDAISPWLVTDAALHYRRRLRDDNSTTPRTLEDSAMILNILLAWGFGVTILGMLWMQSVPARDLTMTAIAAVAFLVSSIISVSSFVMMRRRMRFVKIADTPISWTKIPQVLGIGFGAAALLWVSYLQTKGPINWLSRLDMSGEKIVERPAKWLPYDIARDQFRATWCRREQVGDSCDDFGNREDTFRQEFKARRIAELTDMRRPIWHKTGQDGNEGGPSGRTKPNFRNAILDDTFLAGVNLSEARMEKAKFVGAQLEGATLVGAKLAGADLRHAQLQEANLFKANMNDTKLISADLDSANLRWAAIRNSDLTGTHFNGADMTMAKLSKSYMYGAKLRGVELRGAKIVGAIMDFSQLTGTKNKISFLDETDLRGSANHGGLLRHVDLSTAIYDGQTDFRNVFLDKSVVLPEGLRAQMGNLCQMVEAELDDETFYGHWRGWVEANPVRGPFDNWRRVAPNEYKDVDPISPSVGCQWSITPMPIAASE